MPTYEYTCHKCGKNFDLFQSMKDGPIEVCPEQLCHENPWGQGKVKRLLGTGAGLIFKGSGFYITDYRSDSYKEAAKKDSSPTAAPSKGSDSGSSGSGSAGKETPAAAPGQSTSSSSSSSSNKQSPST